MNGITIIEEHLCRVVDFQSLILIGVFFTLLCVGMLVFYRLVYKTTKIKSTKILSLVCSVGVVVFCVVVWTAEIYNYNKTHFEYTVEVDDSVLFNDFFDRYEIVSVDGDRYRVKEK